MQNSSPGVIRRFFDLIKQLMDALQFHLDNVFQADSPQKRLRQLRHIYYDNPDVTISYRRVKDVLRGQIDPQYYDFYERLLSAERATHRIAKDLHSGARGDELLNQMQTLGEKIVRLVDQLQDTNHISGLYQANSSEAKIVAESQSWLTERIEEALEIHAGIPAKIISFKTAASGRGVEKFSERITHLTNRLDDIAASYADLDNYSPEHLRQIIDDEAESEKES